VPHPGPDAIVLQDLGRIGRVACRHLVTVAEKVGDDYRPAARTGPAAAHAICMQCMRVHTVVACHSFKFVTCPTQLSERSRREPRSPASA
jgi:hypothetical protein